MGHEVVGTEFLLLGILSQNSSMAAKTMKEFGVTHKGARKAVQIVLGRGDPSLLSRVNIFAESKPLSDRASNALREAEEVSRLRTKSDHVGTEHLLLALLRESSGTGVRVLEMMGVDLDRLEKGMLAKIKLEKEAEREAVVTNRKKRRKNKGEGGGDMAVMAGDRGDQSHISLADYRTYTTDLAKAGKLDPLIGRYSEVGRVTQILARRRKNNAVLVGEPGVGKTAIAEGIALRIVQGDVPETLRGKQLVELDMGSLVAGTKYRGEFEERLGNILREVESRDDIIVVIDEIHTLVGAGGSEGGADAANLLKPAMARGKLQLIGATTLEEYRKYIEKDAALERRFQPVMVPEPQIDDCVDILHGLKEKYEDHHGFQYTDDAIKAAVYMSKRYIADRCLPDKAIDVIDEAGARKRLEYDRENEEISEAGFALLEQLQDVVKQKARAVKAQNYGKAHNLYQQEQDLMRRIEEESQDPQKAEEGEMAKKMGTMPAVTESDIAQVIAAVSGIPVDKVNATETNSLMNLEDDMKGMMVGQEDAVKIISDAIRRARTGMRDPSRPIGSFIFAGPTGVGKSQLAKALCASYFGAEENMVRLDMSEYMEKHTVSKLIGSPPGYVGYDEGGGLTEKVRRSPYTLVLFDEVEKAHKDVFNLMLQILDDGRLTDAKGRTVDFKSTMVIMTTNIGSQVIMEQSKKAEEAQGDAYFGEQNDGVDEVAYAAMKEGVNDELKKFFRPEFLNRLDGIVVFHKLTKQNVREIAEIFLKKTYKRMEEKDVKLVVTDAFKDRLVEMGYNPTYGARPLRRAMSTMIEDQLAEVSLRGEMKEGDTVTMDMMGHDKIVILNQEDDLLYTKDISAGNFGIS